MLTTPTLLLILAQATPLPLPWQGGVLGVSHHGQIEGVTFSPDGRFLATADNSGTLLLRDTEFWRIAGARDGKNFTEVAWSPGALVAGGFDSLVTVWLPPIEGAAEHIGPARVFRYGGPVEAVAIVNGVILAAGGGERTIKRWRLDSGPPLPALRGHTDDIYTVRPSPDGKLIASGGRDRTIRIWDAATGKQLRVITGSGDAIYDLAFTPDGARLFSACRDGTISTWSMRTWRLEKKLTGPTNSVHGIAVSPNGRWLAAASFDSQVWIWRLPQAQLVGTLTGHRHNVSAVAFRPDSRVLASVASDTTVRIWVVP